MWNQIFKFWYFDFETKDLQIWSDSPFPKNWQNFVWKCLLIARFNIYFWGVATTLYLILIRMLGFIHTQSVYMSQLMCKVS